MKLIMIEDNLLWDTFEF